MLTRQRDGSLTHDGRGCRQASHRDAGQCPAPGFGVYYATAPDSWSESRYFAALVGPDSEDASAELLATFPTWPAALRAAEALNLAERCGIYAGVAP